MDPMPLTAQPSWFPSDVFFESQRYSPAQDFLGGYGLSDSIDISLQYSTDTTSSYIYKKCPRFVRKILKAHLLGEIESIKPLVVHSLKVRTVLAPAH